MSEASVRPPEGSRPPESLRPAAVSRPPAVLLVTLAFASGLAGLGYEVLYVRHLTTLLGDMLYVHAALLSTFLIGVGAGAWWAHRAWGRLWLLEAGVGLYALLLPGLTSVIGASPFLVEVNGSAALTIAVTAALTVVPAFLVGFTLPLLSGYLRAVRARGSAFRTLYTGYNSGAFLGILLVELLLVRTLGVSGALYTLGGINLVIAAVLYPYRTTWRQPELAEPSGGHTDDASRPADPEAQIATRVLVAVAAGSLASALFQMHLLQTVALVFGPHRENFAVGLAVILAGVAMGAPAATFLGLRLRHALHLAAASVPVVFLFFGPLVDLYGAIGSDSVVVRLCVAMLFGWLPMVLFGAIVPAALRSEDHVARDSGRLLWVSGWANAAGYLLYVTVVHEASGGGVLLLTVSVVASVGGWIASAGSDRRIGALAPAALAVGLLQFFWSDPAFYLAQWRDGLDPEDRVTVFKSGGESATLIREPGRRWVSYNGHPSIVISEGGVVNQAEVLSGVIPALSAPTLERGLVLGLGTGITGGAMARLFVRTEIAEINEAFLEMASELVAFNSEVSANPAATLLHADGRTVLNGVEGEYDAILNSIPTPTYYSASKIYTVEFYRRVRTALRPGGVFSTWLSPSDMTEEGLELVLRTLREVFGRCDLRVMRGDYMMATCSDDPRVRRRIAGLPGWASLEPLLETSIGSLDPDAFLEELRISDDILPGGGTGAINSDDLPLLEFILARGGRPSQSSFVVSPERYGIDWAREELRDDPERWVRRARVLERVAPEAFREWLAPVLSGDPRLRAVWSGTTTPGG